MIDPPALSVKAPGRIDSHVHLWRIDRGDYGWMDDSVGPIRRDYGLADLLPRLDAAGIDQAILVQAAETEAETGFLLDIASSSERIAGVVGWVDLASPRAPGSLRRLAAHPNALAIRPMLQDMAETDWILRPEVLANLRVACDLDLSFDALVRPRQLPAITTLAERLPELRIILDHAAKPLLASGQLEPWRRDLAELAMRPNVWCKLSGLVTEAGPGWTIDTLRPVVRDLLDRFGPGRLLFGSDWPVLDLAGSYQGWWDLVTRFLEPLSPVERALVLGGTARVAYRIGSRVAPR